MRVLYYAHHHGRGHLKRAVQVAGQVGTAGAVRVVTSSPLPLPGVAVDRIPLDVGDDTPHDDVTAHGRLHWAPRHEPRLNTRIRAITDLLDRWRPDVLVSDLSVEVAVLARLAGTPVVSVALPGERGDAAHQLGYGLSDAVLVPWPAGAYRPAWLADHSDRTTYLGCLPSRHPGLPDRPAPPESAGRSVLLVVHGSGGSVVDDEGVDRLRGRLTGWEVVQAGGSNRTDDTSALAARADVVLASAGLGTVSDLAAWGLPTVLLPEPRPFDEQVTTARALAGSVGCPVVADLDEVDETLLAAALARAPRWEAWTPTDAVERAVEAIAAVAAL